MPDFVWNSRKMFRVQIEATASIRLNRSSLKDIRLREKTVSAKLLDLSAGGCGVECSSFLPAGVKLNIFLDRRILLTPEELAKAKTARPSKIVGVVRTSRQVANRRYRLGVQFEKISSEDVKLIKTIIEAHERREEKRITFPQ